MTKEENLHWLNKEIEGWENECQSKHPIKEALYAARKALEQEPCEDAVSRKAVHDMLENLPITVGDKWFNWLQKACMRLSELPSVTPQEQFKPMVEIDLYSVIKQKYVEREVLDKIRAEIKVMSGDIETIADVLQIIDKYREEREVSDGL